MSGKVLNNTIGSFAWMLSIIPLITLLVFSLHAVLVYFQIGHMPIVYEDDFSGSLGVLDYAVGISLVVLVVSIPVVLLCTLLLLYKPLKKILVKQFVLYFILLAIVFLITVFTPLSGFVEWYLD